MNSSEPSSQVICITALLGSSIQPAVALWLEADTSVQGPVSSGSQLAASFSPSHLSLFPSLQPNAQLDRGAVCREATADGPGVRNQSLSIFRRRNL